MSKVSWPPRGFELPAIETRAAVFNALLKAYGKRIPPMMGGSTRAQIELAQWRQRYRDAQP